MAGGVINNATNAACPISLDILSSDDFTGRIPFRLPVPEPVIQPRPENVFVQIDGKRAQSARHVAADPAEVDIEIFKFCPPRADDDELDACSGGPAQVVLALRSQGRAGDVGKE